MLLSPGTTPCAVMAVAPSLEELHARYADSDDEEKLIAHPQANERAHAASEVVPLQAAPPAAAAAPDGAAAQQQDKHVDVYEGDEYEEDEEDYEEEWSDEDGDVGAAMDWAESREGV